MEMGDNKQICGLCLEIVPPGDAVPIGEKKKEILEILLINVDLHIIDNAVACSSCMEELQSGFEFKSACFHVDNCISTFVDAGIPVDMKRIFQQEMRGTAMANVNLENRQICRLCMSLIEDQALDCNADLKDMIGNCLPEVDIHTVHEPLVCELCFSRMKKLNEFMNTCQEVERRINSYYLQAMVDHDIPVSVNLKNLLKFKGNTIKEESLLKEPKKEDTANIECEEIQIKEELDSVDEMGASVPSGTCGKSGKSGSLKSKRQIGEFISKGRKNFSADGHMSHSDPKTNKQFKCDKCLYETNDKAHLCRHNLIHRNKSEVQMHKCDNCVYETRRKDNMIRHMLRHCHPKTEKQFKCDKCPYETNYKYQLSMHNLTHMDKSEVEMRKCESCEFETRRMDNMKQHIMRVHRDPTAERKFKCDKCPYETDFRVALCQHNLIHKDKSEVEMYKCENCEYETGYKSNLMRHILNHHDPKAERKFKCDKCPYETNDKSNLCRHDMIHKDISEVEIHICEKNCGYGTKYKYDMKQHMMKHHDPNAENRYKCDKCPFVTGFMFSLRRHSLKHKDKSEILKCGNCDYETWKRGILNRHMLRHLDPNAGKKFKCDKCPYQTNEKFHLGRHNLRHKDKSEVETLKCYNCEYEAKRKQNLIKHMAKHRDHIAEC